MGFYEDKVERNRALLRALGHVEEPETPPQPEVPPNYDGGAREPFLASDPEQEHNDFLLTLFQNTKLRGGGEW